MTRLNYTTCCPNCAEKLDKLYYMIPQERTERRGVCGWCNKFGILMQYEYSKRQRPRPKPRTGGGERRRAGE